MRSGKLVILFLFLWPGFVFGQDMAFYKANKLYMSQQYDSAAKVYEAILKTGHQSPEIYYNLGNSYYKNGDFTRAILNYERAKKLKPADEDILFNIAVANQKTVDKIEPAPKVFYERWWEQYVASSTPGARGIISLAFVWLAAAAGMGYIFTRSYSLKKLTFFLSFLLLSVGLFFFVVASRQNSASESSREAIIIPDNCYVKSSPDEKSTNLFMLHSGTKIELKDELQGWKKIRIPNGNEGWLKDESLEII